MSIPEVVADWHLQSNYWIIEDHRIDVHAVSVLHPTVQYGLEVEYDEVTSAPLYGTLRSYRPSSVLVTPTNPVLVVLEYEDDSVDFYSIDWDEYREMVNWYIGSGVQERVCNWMQEGF